MSYVGLKHLLAELALEVARDPEHTTWVPVLAAYGSLASSQQLTVPWADVQGLATTLGDRFGWTASPASLAPLVQVKLLDDINGGIRISAPFASQFAYLQRHAPRVMNLVGQLKSLQRPRSVPEDLARGVTLFNVGLFFECHEYLEGLWRPMGGPERNFYHGLIQVAAAFYHYEKRNWHGAQTLLGKGLQRLAPYPAEFLGIRLGALRQALVPWRDAFAAGRKPAMPEGEFPHIEFAAPHGVLAKIAIKKRGGAPRG